jgi:molybdate transport system permease protein
LTGRALFAGLVLCWARALGEFGATILFAGNLPGRTQTMPLAIFIGFQQDLGIALALASILLIVSGLVLGVLRKIESEARLY